MVNSGNLLGTIRTLDDVNGYGNGDEITVLRFLQINSIELLTPTPRRLTLHFWIGFYLGMEYMYAI